MTYSDHTHSINGLAGITYPNMNSYGGWVTTATSVGLFATPKEPEMSAIDQIAKDREKARERAEAEAKFEAFEALGLDDLDDGAVLRYPFNEFWSAAVRNEDGWRTTTGGDAMSTEYLIAMFIRLNLGPEEVEVLG